MQQLVGRLELNILILWFFLKCKLFLFEVTWSKVKVKLGSRNLLKLANLGRNFFNWIWEGIFKTEISKFTSFRYKLFLKNDFIDKSLLILYTYELVMRAIASLWFPERELWPDAKQRVIVYVEGNRKIAMARITSL